MRKPVDYAASKGAILSFTRALAAAYVNTGVRVNSLTPGGAFAGQDEGFVACVLRPDDPRPHGPTGGVSGSGRLPLF